MNTIGLYHSPCVKSLPLEQGKCERSLPSVHVCSEYITLITTVHVCKNIFASKTRCFFFQDDNFNVIFACKIYDNDVLFYFNLLIVIPEINFKKNPHFLVELFFF